MAKIQSLESDIQVITLISYIQGLHYLYQVAVCMDLEERAVSGRFILEK